MTGPKVLLDTNLWNYIVEFDGVEELRRAAKLHDVAVVACPAVVYECLRVPDARLRKLRAKALSRESWFRVMPEAFSETQDLRREIERLRPEWLREGPDLRQWTRLEADWRGAFWRRVRQDPRAVAGHIKELGDNDLRQARDDARVARERAREHGDTMHTFKWDRATAIFARPTPGWDGFEFEAWRASSCQLWWRDFIRGRSQTNLEWLDPWVDRSVIQSDQASWTRFWTREVSTSALPREWIRWAMAEAQATRAYSNGTPGDNQLATYLIDVSAFVTTDKIFADLVEAMRPHCPAMLPKVYRSPARRDALSFLLDRLPEIRKRR